MKSWTLVGMMGAGKSAVGRKLAALSNRTFLDTDQLIINRVGRPIDSIFRLYGEDAFREHEEQVITSLSSGLFVISTGGGAILRESNWNALAKLGPIIYLRATPEVLIRRLQESKKKRPLLKRDDWEQAVREILLAREHIYHQADYIFDLDEIDIESAAQNILKVLEQ